MPDYYCNRCSAPFTARSNRQRYCSKECRLDHRTDDRREWRRTVSALKSEPPAAEELASRPSGPAYQGQDGRMRSKVSGRWINTGPELARKEAKHTVPDEGWRDRRDDEDASRMTSVSGKQAWQLDTLAAKARDRVEHGLPAEIYVPKALGGKPVLVHVYDETVDMIVVVPYDHAPGYSEAAIAAEREALGEAA